MPALLRTSLSETDERVERWEKNVSGCASRMSDADNEVGEADAPARVAVT